MTKYVVGFMFDELLSQVLLIRKIKPEWQNGRLNGVGGKIESDETPKQAMVREFEEETGITTSEDAWTEFCVYTCKSSDIMAYHVVYFFKLFGNTYNAKSITSEKLVRIYLDELFPEDIIYNLNWLIPLALDNGISFPVIITE